MSEKIHCSNLSHEPTQQVTEYFETPPETVNNLVFSHDLEFSLDEFSVHKKDDILKLLNVDNLHLNK